MTNQFKVTGDLSCNNAPKRAFIRDFLIATGTLEKSELEKLVVESFTWNIPNHPTLEGLAKFHKELSNHNREIEVMNIHTIITHGKDGAAHGTVTYKDGSVIHFADFYEFESHKKDAKIKTCTSYVIM